MAKTPAQVQKDLRDRRKAAGQCTSCPGRARAGRTKCSDCQKRCSASHSSYASRSSDRILAAARRRYSCRRRSGKCTRCGAQARDGLSTCAGCSASGRSRKRSWYARRRAFGVCVDCGSRSLGGPVCRKCLDGRKTVLDGPDSMASRRLWREGRWREILLSSALCRARKNGVPFSLTVDDIPDPSGGVCPVFRTEYVIGTGRPSAASATLDRLTPEMGYVPGNVRLMSSLANSIKNNADARTVEAVARAVLLVEEHGVGIPPVLACDEGRRKRMIVQKRAVNARRRELEFSIGWTDIMPPEVCPCTGLLLDYDGSTGDWRLRPSIDRIDNSSGYVPGNVWVISAHANAVKSSATGEQIAMVAAWMRFMNA